MAFNQETADRICERLIDGESLRKICLSDDMPSASTVCRWLAAHEPFREQYAHARDAQADTLADEILDIADDGSNDYMADKEEEDGFRYNGDAVQRSKLRVDARKWLAAKMKPKKYGDKLDLTSGGEAIRPMDDTEKLTRLASIFAKAEAREPSSDAE